jgi:ATP-dependent Clp protease ATP-binding subunit ClpX
VAKGLFDRTPGASEATTYPEDISCNFCGKHRREVRRLIAGPEPRPVYICDECVRLSSDIIAEEVTGVRVPAAVPGVVELRAHFESQVVGQPGAKSALVAALRQHVLRVRSDGAPSRVPRVLLVGPPGVGKTALGRALCAATTLPSVHADATTITEAGYVGDDVETMLHDLLLETGFEPRLAGKGVLFLDSVHTIVRKAPPVGAARDISGEMVQHQLLPLLDGRRVRVSSVRRSHPQAEHFVVDCAGLLVVAAATFDGLLAEAEGAVVGTAGPYRGGFSLGGGADPAVRRALVGRGLLPEFLARFDVLVHLERPDLETLVRLLSGADFGQRVDRLAESLGGRLVVEPEAAAFIAASALGAPEGAWALHRPLSRLANEIALDPSPAREHRVDIERARRLVGHP